MSIPDPIHSALTDSLEDFILARREKKALKTLIAPYQTNAMELSKIRQHAFKLAKDSGNIKAIDWLEDLVKLLIAPAKPAEQHYAYFSPGEDCLNEIRRFIRNAKQQIDICVFSITDNRIVKVIEEVHQRGVKVRIISDDDKSEDLGSDTAYLRQQGIPLVFDVTDAHMHHKFALADRKHLLSGSYNWTRAAALENDENIIITPEPKLVQRFQNEFDRLWQTLEPLQ